LYYVSKPDTRATESIKVKFPDGKTSTSKPASPNLNNSQGKDVVDANNINRNRPNADAQANKQLEERRKKSLEAHGAPLPSACDLMSADFISTVITGPTASEIFVKDGSGKKAVDARACFFKWNDNGNVNGGVLVQVQRNPIPEEFDEWAAYYISSKLNHGDKMPDGSATYRYKRFDGMGVAGAYNYDLARYMWRTESDHVFMVAFNLESSEAEQLIWAEKIGRHLMKNFEKTRN